MHQGHCIVDTSLSDGHIATKNGKEIVVQLLRLLCARLDLVRSFLLCLSWPLLLTALPILAAQTVLIHLEQQALLAFNPGAKTFSSITLSGTTTWIAGSLQDSGNVVLKFSMDGSVVKRGA